MGFMQFGLIKVIFCLKKQQFFYYCTESMLGVKNTSWEQKKSNPSDSGVSLSADLFQLPSDTFSREWNPEPLVSNPRAQEAGEHSKFV